MSEKQSGYISLHRRFRDHWLWTEKRVYSKAEAWIDMLYEARYSSDSDKVNIKGRLYTVNQGETIRSIKTWGKRWGWSVNKVRRFLVLLEKECQIRYTSDTKTTHLSIINYKAYRMSRNADEYANGKQTENKRKQKNKDNKDNKVLKYSCAGPEEAKSTAPENGDGNIVSLALRDKTEYYITRDVVIEMSKLYPDVNVHQEFRNMKGWLIANQSKQKTRRGIKRYYTGWLARAQKENERSRGTISDCQCDTDEQDRAEAIDTIKRKLMTENTKKTDIMHAKIEPLRGEISIGSWEAFIKPLLYAGYENDTVIIFSAEPSWVKDHYSKRISELLCSEVKIVSEL